MTEEWVVYRTDRTPDRTIGEFWFTDVSGRACYTLEDPIQPPGVKIPGNTAIPTGRYRIFLQWSTHFRCLNPHVHAVPNFTGVEIHGGNTAKDVLGCTAVAMVRDVDSIHNSEPAMKLVNERLLNALLNNVEVYCSWVDGPHP